MITHGLKMQPDESFPDANIAQAVLFSLTAYRLLLTL